MYVYTYVVHMYDVYMCVCMYVRTCVLMCVYIQGVPGGKDLTSGECSLGQTVTI